MSEWRRWVDDFMDLAQEFRYDDAVGLRRLKKYTTKSKESLIVWSLAEEGLDYGKITAELTKYKVKTRISDGI